MTWFFRSIGLILAGFIALCVAGFFMPAVQRVDASVQIPADPYEIFEILTDLQSYPDWSGVGGPDSEWVFGGADMGVGQTAAWQSGKRFGSLEIVQAAPGEFIMIKSIGPLGEQNVMLALDETADHSETGFLMQSERKLGGFPYIGRLAALRQKGRTQNALDRAAKGLAELYG